MPTNPAAVQPVRISFTVFGRKPAKAALPGLDTNGIVCGRLGPGRFVWRFCLDGLLAN